MENLSQPPNPLTMADMSAIVTIIEVACTRGAFRADEMTSVGATYDRLRAFVLASTATLSTSKDSDDTPQGETND